MSFLNFRSARRRAKKIVSIRPPRPPTPPTPNSFVSPNIREPTGESAEHTNISTPYQVDVDFSHGPLFASDPFVPGIRNYRPATSSREFRGGPLPTGPGRNGASPKSLPHGVGLEQRKVRALALAPFTEPRRRFPDLLPQTAPSPRRTPKATPAPIKIPTASHASQVQIQRSAGKSAELYGSLNPGDSPALDDGASIVSGTTLPGALIANVWCIQTDQTRDHRLSRRITRSDSATLPSADYAFMSSKCADGDLDVPPVPPLLSAVARGTVNDLAKGQSNMPSGSRDVLREETLIPSREDMGKRHHSHQISPIPELSTPTPSNPVTPDLIKDSSTSAEGSSSQPQTSTSAPSAWSGPTSSSTPPSGEEITMTLPRANSMYIAPSGLRVLLTAQRQPAGAAVDTRRASRSRSGSRPSLSSVNNLILHPATLLPASERRVSSNRRVSVSSGISPSVPSEDADTLSALPPSLGTVYSHHISQLPPFPESAGISSTFTSSSFPSRSGSPSPPPSPDLLDNIYSGQPGSSGEGELRASRIQTPLSALSGSTQTFPETPSAFSPMFSPNNFRTRVSQRLLVGRSVTAKASIGLRAHKKLSRSKLARQPSARFAVDEASGGSSSVSERSEDVATTTKPGEPSRSKEPIDPRGPVASDAFDPTFSQRLMFPQALKAPKNQSQHAASSPCSSSFTSATPTTSSYLGWVSFRP
ncbi:hypothetical protein EDB83DRAFT_2345180 [Lactarius deliciosus]|nr:hypothetical protein EDB83DRAFT_2345180 [Lactarius deliciosus]